MQGRVRWGVVRIERPRGEEWREGDVSLCWMSLVLYNLEDLSERYVGGGGGMDEDEDDDGVTAATAVRRCEDDKTVAAISAINKRIVVLCVCPVKYTVVVCIIKGK